MTFYLSIDVGTGSARAGIFAATGKMLAMASCPIQLWSDGDCAEQSSDDIWHACCKAVAEVRSVTGISAENIHGIGFAATCSLVALDVQDQPITISHSGDHARNVIVWMDHRAKQQAATINQTKHKVLNYVGGQISPEMETPKLLWLKENLPTTWKHAAKYLDLPDFLVYRATGKDVRSLCSTVCKWTYLGHEQANIVGSMGRWDDSYFQQVGLQDLCDEGYARIGRIVRPMGEGVGEGLTAQSAKQLGLKAGTPVSVSIIDAHAGGIGLLAASKPNSEMLTSQNLCHRLALISGTSTCHMAVSTQAQFVPGVWGPYYSAMIPGMWLAEGGQSATGALIDHVINSHACSAELQQTAQTTNQSIYDILNQRLTALAKKVKFPALLTRDIHVLPYYHGNRSPRANPHLKGMVSGLRLANHIDDLALQYYATIQALAYGTRHIIDTLNENGYQIDTLLACGGGTKTHTLLKAHADITGCRVILPKEREAVLLGAAILAAVACGDVKTVLQGMQSMTRIDQIIEPTKGEVAGYHAAKYKVFQQMYHDQINYSKLMANSGARHSKLS